MTFITCFTNSRFPFVKKCKEKEGLWEEFEMADFSFWFRDIWIISP